MLTHAEAVLTHPPPRPPSLPLREGIRLGNIAEDEVVVGGVLSAVTRHLVAGTNYCPSHLPDSSAPGNTMLSSVAWINP